MNLIPDDIRKQLQESSDSALIARYKSGDLSAINGLIANHRDLIDAKSRAYTNIPVPQDAVKGHAMSIVAAAARSYDPNTGVQFRTFLDRHLKGLNRYVHRHKNALHFPDAKGLMISKYQEAVADLTRRYGQIPPDYIIADRLGWSINDVGQIKAQLSRRELAASGLDGSVSKSDLLDSAISSKEEAAEFVYHSMPEQDKQIFDYALGRHGKSKLGTDSDIAKHLGLTLSKVNRARKEMARQINKISR